MKAIFPGSFDPLTNGHLDLIKRASQLYDQLLVVVGNNTSKKAWFSPTEKLVLLQEVCQGLDNVSIQILPADLTVNLAREVGAQVIIRGVRNHQDFEYEQTIANLNKKLAPEIETLLLFADEKYTALSSSMLKEIARFGGDISELVPSVVVEAMQAKLSRKEV